MKLATFEAGSGLHTGAVVGDGVVDLTAAAPYQILREGPAVVIAFDVAPESPIDSSVATPTASSS